MNFSNIFGKKKTVQSPDSKNLIVVSGPSINQTTKLSDININKTESNQRNFAEGMVSTKDIIAPSALEVDTDFIRIGNKYYRTVFTIINRRFVEINWLSTLINFDASLAVSMYVYPSDGKEILDDLRRKITEMEAELSTDIQRGRIVNPATQAKLEDALNLQADLVKGEERFFQMGLYVTITSDTIEDLDRITKNLESGMGALMVLTKKTTYMAEDGFITTLPLCQDRLNITRNMDTTSLATTFPFVSSDLSDDKGIMFGINEHNGSLVIFDRFSMPNYNSVVFATAGAGKSYMIKLEVLRSLMLGTEIIVIDPENEYKDLCEASGGQYIAFGYGEISKINPFDLSLVNEEGENALNAKVLTLHKLFKIMLGEMDSIEESLVDRAIIDAYKMKGITPDPASQTREPPLIEDLYKSLVGMEDQKAAGLAARIEKYIKGSFAGIFNQKTTVNLTNQFVVFGIKNLEESLRPVAMHIILDYIWTVVKKELKRRILVVDEAWYLMQYPDSAAFLRGIVKRGRKYYLGTTTITQDVDDFLQTPFGREIVTNSSIQILLKQHSAAIDQVGEVFYLSEGEKQLLLAADKGEGIFFAGQNHVAIRVVASEDEHRLITSNPEEVMRMKQQVKLALQKKDSLTTTSVQQPTVPTPPQVTTQTPTQAPQQTPSQTPVPLTQPEDNKKIGYETVVTNTNPEANNQASAEEILKKRIQDMEVEEKQKIEEHKKKLDDEIKTKEEEKNKMSGTLGNFGSLPKYQDLFVNKSKLPPLPPLPKFSPPSQEPQLPKFEPPVNPISNNPTPVKTMVDKQSPSIPDNNQITNSKLQNENKIQFKTEVVNDQKITNKPLFVNQVKEVNIPQPPQLVKKPTPVFETPKPPETITENSQPIDSTNLKSKNLPPTQELSVKDKTKMDYDKLFGNGIV